MEAIANALCHLRTLAEPDCAVNELLAVGAVTEISAVKDGVAFEFEKERAEMNCALFNASIIENQETIMEVAAENLEVVLCNARIKRGLQMALTFHLSALWFESQRDLSAEGPMETDCLIESASP